jgi:peptide/nickel transport system permease protein
MADVQAVPAGGVAHRRVQPRSRRPGGGAMFWTAAGFTALYLLVAVFGPLVVPYDGVATSIADRLLSPLSTTSTGSTAWLGTDQVGRDLPGYRCSSRRGRSSWVAGPGWCSG